MKLSIVSPIFQGEMFLNELVNRIIRACSSITEDFEVILVEDASRDQSWFFIEKLCKLDNRVKGIKLSRNFGQQAAIYAGLKFSSGEFVVVLDCDLQDDPKYIKELYEESQKGNQIVYTSYKEKKHSFRKKLLASAYYTVFGGLARSDRYNSTLGNYSMISRKVVDAFCEVKDVKRHYLLTLQWLGFESSKIEVEHNQRTQGKSNYSVKHLVKLAIDGIVFNSGNLLRLPFYFAALFFVFSIVFFAASIVPVELLGMSRNFSILLGLLSFITFSLLISLGFIGLYISATFEQVKSRPIFVTSKLVNLES